MGRGYGAESAAASLPYGADAADYRILGAIRTARALLSHTTSDSL